MENLDLLETFNTLINKTGIFILLIFGIKILVNLYKYNIRMADFYTSRANIIELADNSDLKIAELKEVFDVSKINFEKTPDSLYNELLEIVKQKAKQST